MWSSSSVPGLIDSGDTMAGEFGFLFQSTLPGTITGIRFYKASTNTGTHIGNLWSTSGNLLATVTFTGESASGWQQASFSAPVPIAANTTYVASYFAPNSHYSLFTSYFTSTVTSMPLLSPQDGLDGSNGVFTYSSSSTFPSSTYESSNYYVDVVFVPNASATSPTVTSATPASGSTGVSLGSSITATFSEPMSAPSITATSVVLQQGGSTVPATVTYNAASASAVLTPTLELSPNTTYTVTVQSGVSGVADYSGNVLASNYVWSFTTGPAPASSGPGGPILVITSAANPFTTYLGEILSAEGLNEYTLADMSTLTASTLSSYDLAILGDMYLTGSEVSMLTTWVNGGGKLIAMHPDPQLAGLLGLTTTASTLSDGYLNVNTVSGPGVGIVGQPIQFHGTAEMFTVNGAATYATLYANSTTATTSPAVTLATAGNGQAAAFSYDLARSVVYTRQGNPAWSGQPRDGQISPIRPDDLFFGAASFDPELDWVNLGNVAIPQADEQQRLLANLILQMEMSNKPLPRFWYFPSGYQAVVVLTGDDHGSYYGGSATANRFSDDLAASPAGCSVANWTCVRATAYLFPSAVASNTLTNAQAAAYLAQGFEIGVHVDSETDCTNWTRPALQTQYTTFLASLAGEYPSLPAPTTHRMHCLGWSDYDSQPLTELQNGIRFDTSYYYWPPTWVNNVPGMFTGSGMPMRYTDRYGNLINVYQAATQMTDESGQTYPFTIQTLLANALGSTGYYGAFVVNAHNDAVDYPGIGPDIISSAQAVGVPLVSSQQMLTWLDGRNTSSFGSVSWSGNTLSFTVSVGAGANNIMAMLPVNGPGAPLAGITFGGSPVTYTTPTIKGVTYAMFSAAAGTYQATYAPTYSVSGTIGGSATAATVTLTSGATTVASTTASAGAYSFTGIANGSYTVTPTSTGFAFSPASQPVTVNGANVTVPPFSSAAQTYTISGTINGAGDNAATLTLTSGITTVAIVMSTSAGAYTFTGIANGSYTVTPTNTGFAFTPANAAVTVNGANATVAAFSSAVQTFTVAGTISGTGGNAVTVKLTSGSTTVATVTSTSAGAYTFTGIANGSYTVTPTNTGFAFTPTSAAVTVNQANATVAAFSSAVQTFTVAGTISGTGGNAATVKLASGSTTVATVTATSAGAYSFTGIANGSYTVTPTKTGFTFTPASAAVTVNGANVTVAAFNSAVQTFTVAGTISGTGGNAATVKLTSGSTTVATVTATSAGAYTFTGIANGSYTVTPTKTGFTFTPASAAVTVNGANVTVPVFTAISDATPIVPYIQVNGGSWQQTATATVSSGSTVNLGPQPLTGGSWSWTGPKGYTSTSRQINSIPLSTGTSTFIATYTNSSGVKSTQTFTITVT
jgi:hypothetical protein